MFSAFPLSTNGAVLSAKVVAPKEAPGADGEAPAPLIKEFCAPVAAVSTLPMDPAVSVVKTTFGAPGADVSTLPVDSAMLVAKTAFGAPDSNVSALPVAPCRYTDFRLRYAVSPCLQNKLFGDTSPLTSVPLLTPPEPSPVE